MFLLWFLQEKLLAEEIRTSQLFNQVELLQQELDSAKAQAAREAEEARSTQEELLAKKSALQEAVFQLQADLQVTVCSSFRAHRKAQ